MTGGAKLKSDTEKLLGKEGAGHRRSRNVACSVRTRAGALTQMTGIRSSSRLPVAPASAARCLQGVPVDSVTKTTLLGASACRCLASGFLLLFCKSAPDSRIRLSGSRSCAELLLWAQGRTLDSVLKCQSRPLIHFHEAKLNSPGRSSSSFIKHTHARTQQTEIWIPEMEM